MKKTISLGISIIDFSHYDHLYIFYFLLCHYTSVLSYGKGTGRKILKILVMLYREIHKLYKHSKIITIIKVSKNKCYSLAKNQI